MRCTINGITHQGEGVGRIDGKAVFIPFSIPGETVEIEITAENKSYLRGKLVEVIEPSKDRVVPDCLHYYECGGCAYQHMAYSRQLELKQQVVKDSLQRIGKIDCEVRPVIGMKDPWRYRNKVEWHVENHNGQVRMGYYKNESHELIDITTCKLISRPMEELSFYIKDKIASVKKEKQGRLTVRESSYNGKLLAVLTELNLQLDGVEMFPNMILFKQEARKLNLTLGEGEFPEKIHNTRYNLSPLSFFQVNPVQTQVLYDLVKTFSQPQADDQILDAFCGAGTIALYLASSVKKVTGVESYVPAIDDAIENAALNGITNCGFISGACETVIPQLNEHFDMVVLDPPRIGCKPEVLAAITKIAPRSIIYVSCNPATLARDLAILISSGYHINEVQPIDMFPQTRHTECVAELCRKEKVE